MTTWRDWPVHKDVPLDAPEYPGWQAPCPDCGHGIMAGVFKAERNEWICPFCERVGVAANA